MGGRKKHDPSSRSGASSGDSGGSPGGGGSRAKGRVLTQEGENAPGKVRRRKGKMVPYISSDEDDAIELTNLVEGEAKEADDKKKHRKVSSLSQYGRDVGRSTHTKKRNVAVG